MKTDILVYDTTLRDGTQGEQINFTAEEKIRIAKRLDEAGFHYIEGGWPGSNPKDARFFDLAKSLTFDTAKLTAFSSTRRADLPVEDCPVTAALLAAETPAVAIFGKTWDLHATEILGVDLAENLAMIRETIAYCKARGREVIFDAEHFFDGFKHNPAYAREVIEAALEAGADFIVLCDTNGGTLPVDVQEMTEEMAALVPPGRLGIHAHNDGGLAVANSLAAVQAGAFMVQGTINGLGERCGNADLIPIIANLQLKMGRQCLPDKAMRHLTGLSNFVSEVANLPPQNNRPFVGRSAFAHKGGIHVSAIQKNAAAYEHIPPESVGNGQRVLVSDLSGKSNIEYKARELGIALGDDPGTAPRIVREIKRMEDEGYRFDAAEASLALLIRKAIGAFEEPFALDSFQVLTSRREGHPYLSQATIKIVVKGEEELTAAEGNGPVNALDHALRKALTTFYPEIRKMHLTDFKVRIVEGSEGTAAKVQVAIESTDGDETWRTIGVSENVLEASWLALVDSVQYKLLKQTGR